MSTRGSFIIRKDSEEKELYIPSDAYPSGAGTDVCRMIKSLDMNKLYGLLQTCEDDFVEAPGDFIMEYLVRAYRKERPYIYEERDSTFILDSLMCEYAYVVDLDEQNLYFYVGNQKKPQEGNRYGTDDRKGYYPCALRAIFNFPFIRQNETEETVQLMQDARKTEEIQRFEAEPVEIAANPPHGMRQLVIARKDLQMSAGKLAAQVSHASMAFIAHMLRKGSVKEELSMETCDVAAYRITVTMQPDVYRDWFQGIFTKTICEAKNKNHLMKAVTMAEELGLKENQDFFLIKDSCLTELEPEEYDKEGKGHTLTCIGFRPLPDDIAHAISKKYQLYR